ncbi:hypothetical protein DFH28DRAFT_1041203 [Melampsora americana]|nr:hypothetical protein DFH28DRAFT_1041203 [Melampsora americana]
MLSSLLSEGWRAQGVQGAEWLLDIMGGPPSIKFKFNWLLCFWVIIFGSIIKLFEKVVPLLFSEMDKVLVGVQEATDKDFSPLGESITPLLDSKRKSTMFSYGTMEKTSPDQLACKETPDLEIEKKQENFCQLQ